MCSQYFVESTDGKKIIKKVYKQVMGTAEQDQIKST